LTAEEQDAARGAWVNAAGRLAGFLYEQIISNMQAAYDLARHELSNMLSTLNLYAQSGTPEEVIDFATQVETLAQQLGRKKAVEWAGGIRRTAAGRLGDWSRSACLAASTAIDRLMHGGRTAEAAASAERLLEQCLAAGKNAYRGAAYDIAMAYARLGRAHQMAQAIDAAIVDLIEAEQRFNEIAESGHAGAARMAYLASTDRADCLTRRGRLDEAAVLYQRVIDWSQDNNDPRQAAVGKVQLANVRRLQRRFGEAISLNDEAKDAFERLGEPELVAVAWHQIAMVYRNAGEYPSAEHACQQSLKLRQSIGNRGGQAATFSELGILYMMMGRNEDAVRFCREAAVIYVEQHDLAMEGRVHNNAALSLIRLERFDEARRELLRAIECGKPFGHSAEPWTTFNILYNMEAAVGDAAAAQDARAKAITTYLAYRRDGGQVEHPVIEQWLKEDEQS